eukprot:symbB.v1.2.023194.t1/scaffold2107.1/size91221/3
MAVVVEARRSNEAGALAEQLCSAELQAQDWRRRCFQAEAQLRLERLKRRGEQHPRWPANAMQQQTLMGKHAALQASDIVGSTKQVLWDLVHAKTSLGQLEEDLEQSSQEVQKCQKEAAQKREDAITLTEGQAAEDAAFAQKELDMNLAKDRAGELARLLQESFTLENELAEKVALGQDAMEVVHRKVQAFLPAQQKVQEEAQKALQEADRFRVLAQRRREAVTKTEEEVDQVEKSGQEENAALQLRLEQTRDELSEMVAKTADLGDQARKAQVNHSKQIKAVKDGGSALRDALSEVGQDKEDLQFELQRLRDIVESASLAHDDRQSRANAQEAANEDLENGPVKAEDVKATVQPDDWTSVLLLSGAWACAFSIFSGAIATLSLAVGATAPDGLETLPLSLALILQGVSNLVLPIFKQKLSLTCTYLLGGCLGIVACGLLVLGCFLEEFSVQCLGAALLGFSLGFAQNYRFVAVLLLPSNPANAVSAVLFGGVLGSLLGPGALAQAKDMLEAPFAGIYMLGGCVFAVSLVLLACVKFPPVVPPSSDAAEAPRKLATILRQPSCLSAVLTMASSYSIMLLLMAPTPVVMQQYYQHGYVPTTLTMMGHMFCMFAPSPFTGKLVSRCGSLKVIHCGLALACATAIILWLSSELWAFVFAMTLLGFTWNFMFLGGTVLLNSSVKAAESLKIVAVADCTVFLTAAVFTVLSMPLVSTIGWPETQFATMSMAVLVALCLGVAAAVAKARYVKLRSNPALRDHRFHGDAESHLKAPFSAGCMALEAELRMAHDSLQLAEVAHTEATGSRSGTVKAGLLKSKEMLSRAQEAAQQAAHEAQDALQQLESLRSEKNRLTGETGVEAERRQAQTKEEATQVKSELETTEAECQRLQDKMEWHRHLREAQQFARCAAKEAASNIRGVYGDLSRGKSAKPSDAATAQKAARRLSKHLEDFLRFLGEAHEKNVVPKTATSINLNLPSALKEAYVGKLAQNEDSSRLLQQLDATKEKLKAVRNELQETQKGHQKDTVSLQEDLEDLQKRISEGEEEGKEAAKKTEEAQQRLSETITQAGYKYSK